MNTKNQIVLIFFAEKKRRGSAKAHILATKQKKNNVNVDNSFENNVNADNSFENIIALCKTRSLKIFWQKNK